FTLSPCAAYLAARPPAPRSQSSGCAPNAMTRTGWFCASPGKARNDNAARTHTNPCPQQTDFAKSIAAKEFGFLIFMGRIIYRTLPYIAILALRQGSLR